MKMIVIIIYKEGGNIVFCFSISILRRVVMSTRTEHDTMGNVEVPSEAYWGAQTQRSRNNFKIGGETLPQPLIYALALVKKAAAATNVSLGRIKPEQADLITQAADDVLNSKLDGQFPLVVWQTGSGTQSNMNMNEVLAKQRDRKSVV